MNFTLFLLAIQMLIACFLIVFLVLVIWYRKTFPKRLLLAYHAFFLKSFSIEIEGFKDAGELARQDLPCDTGDIQNSGCVNTAKRALYRTTAVFEVHAHDLWAVCEECLPKCEGLKSKSHFIK